MTNSEETKPTKKKISFEEAINLVGNDAYNKFYFEIDYNCKESIVCRIYTDSIDYITLFPYNIFNFLILAMSDVDRYSCSSHKLNSLNISAHTFAILDTRTASAHTYLDYVLYVKKLIDEKENYEFDEISKNGFEEIYKLKQAFEKIIDLYNKSTKTHDKQKEQEYKSQACELADKLMEQSIYKKIKDSFIKIYNDIEGLK